MDLQSSKNEAPEEYDEYSKYIQLPKSKGPVNNLSSGVIYTIPNKTSQNDEIYDGKYTTPYEKHTGVLVNKGDGAVPKRCNPDTQAIQEDSNTYMDINAIETVRETNQETPHLNETQSCNRYALPEVSKEFSGPKIVKNTEEKASFRNMKCLIVIILILVSIVIALGTTIALQTKTRVGQSHLVFEVVQRKYLLDNVRFEGPFWFFHTDLDFSIGLRKRNSSWIEFNNYCNQKGMSLLQFQDLGIIVNDKTESSKTLWTQINGQWIWLSKRNEDQEQCEYAKLFDKDSYRRYEIKAEDCNSLAFNVNGICRVDS